MCQDNNNCRADNALGSHTCSYAHVSIEKLYARHVLKSTIRTQVYLLYDMFRKQRTTKTVRLNHNRLDYYKYEYFTVGPQRSVRPPCVFFIKPTR